MSGLNAGLLARNGHLQALYVDAAAMWRGIRESDFPEEPAK